jgi:WGR domain
MSRSLTAKQGSWSAEHVYAASESSHAICAAGKISRPHRTAPPSNLLTAAIASVKQQMAAIISASATAQPTTAKRPARRVSSPVAPAAPMPPPQRSPSSLSAPTNPAASKRPAKRSSASSLSQMPAAAAPTSMHVQRTLAKHISKAPRANGPLPAPVATAPPTPPLTAAPTAPAPAKRPATCVASAIPAATTAASTPLPASAAPAAAAAAPPPTPSAASPSAPATTRKAAAKSGPAHQATTSPEPAAAVVHDVDPECPIGRVSVVEDYSVTLNQTNVDANNNKFYRLQVLGAPC